MIQNIAFPRLRRIHWKLALAYAVVTTLAAVIAITLLVSAFAIFFNTIFASPADIEEVIQPLPNNLIDALERDQTQSGIYQEWADQIFQDGRLVFIVDGDEVEENINAVSVLDRDGQLLAQRKFSPSYSSAVEVDSFRQKLQALTDLSAQRVEDEIPENKSVVIPITKNQQLLGFAIFEVSFPEIGDFRNLLPPIGIGILIILFLSMILGTGFGYLSTRSLVNRLTQLGDSAEKWAQGLFHTRVNVSSGDEIGDLESNLNQMATQLQTLIETRQQLSTLAERGRIARELHDTVKQQVFATQMHLSSARFVIEENPKQATEILDTIIQLNEQTQNELITLIHALRPPEINNEGFISALNTYIIDWGQQVDATINFETNGEHELPLKIEIALYRVMQEALNNIAKHAQAQNVMINLTYTENAVMLNVHDDGVGFDQSDQKKMGFGLTSMRQRLESLAGKLKINSDSGQGTQVIATIDLN